MFATTASMMSRACRRGDATGLVVGSIAAIRLRRSLALAGASMTIQRAVSVGQPHRVGSVDGCSDRPVPRVFFAARHGDEYRAQKTGQILGKVEGFCRVASVRARFGRFTI